MTSVLRPAQFIQLFRYTKQFVYLASPYMHPDESIRKHRVKQAHEYCARFMNTGVFVYCPISMNAGVEPILKRWDHSRWMTFDLKYLERCDVLAVLCLDGWLDSIGVNMEINEAKIERKPICYLEVPGESADHTADETVDSSTFEREG